MFLESFKKAAKTKMVLKSTIDRQVRDELILEETNSFALEKQNEKASLYG